MLSRRVPSSLKASLTTSHCQIRPLKWAGLVGDVLAQDRAQLVGAEVALGEPGGQLVVPEQGVAAHQLSVGSGEVDQFVGGGPVVGAALLLDDLPLHDVLRCDGGELARRLGPVGRVGGQGRHVDCCADAQVGPLAEAAQSVGDGELGLRVGAGVFRCGRGAESEGGDEQGRGGGADHGGLGCLAHDISLRWARLPRNLGAGIDAHSMKMLRKFREPPRIRRGDRSGGGEVHERDGAAVRAVRVSAR